MLPNPYQSRINRIAGRIFRWFLTALVLAVVLWLGFLLTGRLLCRTAIKQIAELTGTKIQTESIDFRTNGSVFIKNLVISPYEKQAGEDFILKAEAVSGRFGIAGLLLLRPRLKTISVDDFVFNVRCDLDSGLWNLAGFKLRVPKGGSGQIPLIVLQRGTLQYSKISQGQVKVAASVPLAAKFVSDTQTQDGCSFEITTAKMAAASAKSRLTGAWKPGLVTIAGGISSTDVSALEMSWLIDNLAAELKYDPNSAFALKLRIKDFRAKLSPSLDKFALVGPSFLEKSGRFTALQRFFNRYQPSGRIDLSFDASGNLNRLDESSLSGKVYCKDVAVCYSGFPYKIERLVGSLDFTGNTVTFDNLIGSHRDVKLSINGWIRDFAPDWKYQVRIASGNMTLDNDLYDALGDRHKEFWSAYSPRGLAAVDYQLARNSQTDKNETLTVDLLNAEALYRDFPYPLKNLTGKLIFDGETIIVSNVVSQPASRTITLNGKAVTDANKPAYSIQIDVNNVPLDSTLKQALPAAQRNLCDQLTPTGLIDGRINVSSPGPDSNTANYTADLFFKNASLKPRELPIPISEVSANAVFTPDSINVKSLTGLYDRGRLSLSGRIQPDLQNKPPGYSLAAKLEQVQLNDNLFALLPASLRKIVSDFQPDGKVNLSARLTRTDTGSSPSYEATIDCLGDSINFKQFPYPLKDVTGALMVTNDAVEFRNITAAPAGGINISQDAPIIKLNGRISRPNGAFNSAALQLSASNIFFNEQLAVALPQALRGLYGILSPIGRFDLDLATINVSNADDGQKYIDLAGSAGLKACGLNISAARAELDAMLKTRILYKTGHGLLEGRATILADTVTIHGKSLTAVAADLLYDPNLRTWASSNLLADFYGGKLAGRLEFKQPADAPSQYLLQLGFDNVDLRQFLSAAQHDSRGTSGDAVAMEFTNPDSRPTSHEHTSGKMSGSLSLASGATDTASRIGLCRLKITDMKVGRLSPLGKLLLVLNLTEPKDFAFSRMLVDSYIKRNRLFFRKFDLSGEAIAFYGSGWMNLNSGSIDLTLIARGHRLATADPSVLQSLTEDLGQAVVRMEVTGDLFDPRITTKTFPVIKQSLEILGSKPPAP